MLFITLDFGCERNLGCYDVTIHSPIGVLIWIGTCAFIAEAPNMGILSIGASGDL